MVNVEITKLKCLRCGYEWYPRKPKLPEVCPNPHCKSRYWNRPRQNNHSK